MKRIIITLLLLSCWSIPALGAVIGEPVSYKAGGLTLNGSIAYYDSKSLKRPGILVVHEWWGHNEYARKRARMLAELGYTALAVDMYGDGRQADHPGPSSASWVCRATLLSTGVCWRSWGPAPAGFAGLRSCRGSTGS